MTPALGIMTAGCSSIGGSSDSGVEDSDGDGVIDSEDYAPQDPDVQDKSDVENSEEEQEPSNQESNDTDEDSEEEELIEYDSTIDLLPDPNSIQTDDDWQVTQIEQNPDTDLQVDVTAFYTIGGPGPMGNVAVTAYDNIPDAEQRYDDSLSNAELEKESVEEITPFGIDAPDTETYTVSEQGESWMVSRYKNVFSKSDRNLGMMMKFIMLLLAIIMTFWRRAIPDCSYLWQETSLLGMVKAPVSATPLSVNYWTECSTV